MMLLLQKIRKTIQFVEEFDEKTHATITINEQPRITELSNEMSMNIDISSPMEIIRILRACDSQIFSGWQNYPNIYDLIPTISNIITKSSNILSDCTNNRIILSGSGTSGRLGFIISRCFNEYLKSINKYPCFDYCHAGYDPALLTSIELPEDDPKTGVKDLLNATKNIKGTILLIGITCGLSAPYVGGQIEYAMNKPNFITVLIGFNPIQLSRNTKVEKWDGKTFKDIALQFNELTKNYNTNCFILNPICGPETITGI